MRMLTTDERALAVAGLALYAHWDNGRMYVGTMGRTFKEAAKDIMDGREDANILVQSMVAREEAQP